MTHEEWMQTLKSHFKRSIVHWNSNLMSGVSNESTLNTIINSTAYTYFSIAFGD